MDSDLLKIFNDNKDKRICVLGTTCTGKSTLIRKLNIGEDMDDAIFPLLSEDEKQYVCQDPWTVEIGKKMDELVQSRLVIKPGIPLFGTVLLDSDLIVYLHISDNLLLNRTKLRNANFNDAKNMQRKIEDDIFKSGIKVITLEVEEE